MLAELSLGDSHDRRTGFSRGFTVSFSKQLSVQPQASGESCRAPFMKHPDVIWKGVMHKGKSQRIFAGQLCVCQRLPGAARTFHASGRAEALGGWQNADPARDKPGPRQSRPQIRHECCLVLAGSRSLAGGQSAALRVKAAESHAEGVMGSPGAP